MVVFPLTTPEAGDIAREVARLHSAGESNAAALLEELHRQLTAHAEIGVPCPVCDGTGSFEWEPESTGFPAFHGSISAMRP